MMLGIKDILFLILTDYYALCVLVILKTFENCLNGHFFMLNKSKSYVFDASTKNLSF